MQIGRVTIRKSSIAKLMFELLVVFIGVLLAFIVNEYREERVAEQRQCNCAKRDLERGNGVRSVGNV